MAFVKDKRFHSKPLAAANFRSKLYKLARDLPKLPTLFTGPTSVLRGRDIPRLAVKAVQVLRAEGLSGLHRRFGNKIDLGHEYLEWTRKYDTLTDADRVAIRQQIERLTLKPLISVIMPTYNSSEKWLRVAIESIRKQLYPNWELCIADDSSSKARVKEILEEYRDKDARIRLTFREKTGHISAASNSAIEMATGELLALFDHDDELSEHALYMVAAEFNAHSGADLIYSDEDKIDEVGRRYDPYFKPDWNPALFLGQNFISHLTVYRAQVVKQLGGFRLGCEGAQDWDLALRVIEGIPASHIRHIPHVLYHWRAIHGSTARRSGEKKYVREAQRRSLQAHFERVGLDVTLVSTAGNYWRVRYPLPVKPLVSLIIPTHNGYQLLHRCIESIYHKTTYPSFEVIIVDHRSDDAATLNYLAILGQERQVKTLRYDAPFNFSAINNLAVQYARGEVLGLLNNDIEVIAPDWLDEMVSHALRPEIGAVGAKLYYPDNRIQHAGVILGLNGTPGIAGHRYQNKPRDFPGQASRALLCQNLSAVTAACLVVRRQVFEEVGGFDAINLAVSFNDVDLCLRILEKGYRNLWTPYAELYHHESASRGADDTPEKVERTEKECAYMRQRWGDLLANDPAHNPNLALAWGIFSLATPPRVMKPWLVSPGS